MSRLVQSGLMVIVLLAGGSTAYRDIHRAENLYDAGRYGESYEAFKRALDARGDPALQYSVGNALYRMHRYEEAARSFREAAAVPRLRQQSYYNLGNASVRAAEDTPNDKTLLLVDAVLACEE